MWYCQDFDINILILDFRFAYLHNKPFFIVLPIHAKVFALVDSFNAMLYPLVAVFYDLPNISAMRAAPAVKAGGKRT